MLRNLTTRSYVSIGLSFILVTILLVAMLFGLVPDRAGAIRASRATIAETIAAYGSASITDADTDRLRTTLRLAVDRNDDLLSAAVRRSDGTLAVSVGDHERQWQGNEGDVSTSANVNVPIWSDGALWGRIELRFVPLFAGGAFGVLGDQRLHLMLFILIAAFFAFRTYLGRVLKHLDPAQAVPPHVRSALDTLAEGLLVVDKREFVVLANEAFASITGHAADKLVGRRASDLGFTDASGQRVSTDRSPWQAALETGTPRRNEMLHLDDAGGAQRTFIVNCSPVLGTGGEHAGVLISLDDVTQLEANKVELKLSKGAAEAANQAKSDFLANMSHEIRTPMNAILGFTDILRRGYDKSTSERSKYLDTIHSSGKHLLQLINDVLDLSKVEAGRVEVERLPTAAHTIVNEVASVLRVRAEEKGIDLTLEVNGEIPAEISTDPTRLRQIVTNLIGNAIKFTEHGGVRVVLSLQDHDGAPQYAIRIIDSGIGIDAEALESVFEPFVQADASVTRRFGGTGLGLAISRRFARLLGGDIVAHSTVGEGTVFVVTLDAGELAGTEMLDAAAAIADAAVSAPQQVVAWRFPSPTRVLVVDDGEENRELVQLVLQNVGIDVAVAENGQVAVDVVREQAFDLILMDMQMPVLDGYGATRQLRADGVEVPIIALTADAMKGFEDKCLAAGCTGYLTKPVDIDQLLETLGERLGGTLDTNIAATAAEAPHPGIAVSVAEPELASGDPNRLIHSRLAHAGPAIQATVCKFVDGLDDRFAAARRALAAGDMEAIAGFAHWIKGAGGTVGFDEFTKPAARLETFAKSRAIDYIEPALAALETIGAALVRPGDVATPGGRAELPAAAVAEVSLPEPDESKEPVVSRLLLENPRMRPIVEQFHSRLDERMAELRAALAAQDCAAVCEIAVWLKGAAATVGYDVFIEPADHLETSARTSICAAALAWTEAVERLVARIDRDPGATTGKAVPSTADNRA